MKEIDKDIRSLKGTLVFCEDIKSALNRYGKNYQVFAHDRVFFHAVSMSSFQIGELANKLSQEFKERNSSAVDWRKLKYIRNIFAHAYSNIKKRDVWDFATMFVPVYENFCRLELARLQKESRG